MVVIHRSNSNEHENKNQNTSKNKSKSATRALPPGNDLGMTLLRTRMHHRHDGSLIVILRNSTIIIGSIPCSAVIGRRSRQKGLVQWFEYRSGWKSVSFYAREVRFRRRHSRRWLDVMSRGRWNGIMFDFHCGKFIWWIIYLRRRDSDGRGTVGMGRSFGNRHRGRGDCRGGCGCTANRCGCLDDGWDSRDFGWRQHDYFWIIVVRCCGVFVDGDFVGHDRW